MEKVEEETIAAKSERKGSHGTVTMKKKWVLLLQLLVLMLCVAGLFGKDKTWNMEGAEFSGMQQEDGRFVFTHPFCGEFCSSGNEKSLSRWS